MRTSAGGNASRNAHSFARAPGQRVPRSVFNRSHGLKTAFNAGDLIPIMAEELLPGDTISISENLFARFTTLVLPIMHPVFLETFWFAVPCRLLWDNFEKFHGAVDDPADVGTEYEIPQMTVPGSGFAEESLADYLGIPPGVVYDNLTAGSEIGVSALYFRAYTFIYDEWFRDQDIIAKQTYPRDDGPDTVAEHPIQKRAKRPDYFSSCRPWPQKGTEVVLPLGTSAPVSVDTVVQSGATVMQWTTTGGPPVTNFNADGSTSTPTYQGTPSSGGLVLYDIGTSLTGTADLASATAATINQLREAFATQAVYEVDARSGTRYVEHLVAHFGQRLEDHRAFRPIFLGGSSTQMAVNPVAQTTPTASMTQLADLGAYATFGSFGKRIVYTAPEDMILLCIANVRADVVYQQGLHKRFQRKDRFDFYLPTLAHLGEQAVLSAELWADGSANDEDVFGYQERWAELRYGESRTTGKLRSTATDTLEVWQLAQEFSTRPTLNQTFIEENPPMDRVAVVDPATEPVIKLDAWFEISHARPMPTFSVPAGLVRF